MNRGSEAAQKAVGIMRWHIFEDCDCVDSVECDKKQHEFMDKFAAQARLEGAMGSSVFVEGHHPELDVKSRCSGCAFCRYIAQLQEQANGK